MVWATPVNSLLTLIIFWSSYLSITIKFSVPIPTDVPAPIRGGILET